MMLMSDTLRDAVIANVPANEMKRLAIGEGMPTLRAAGNNKILEGRTTIEEVMSSTMSDDLG